LNSVNFCTFLKFCLLEVQKRLNLQSNTVIANKCCKPHLTLMKGLKQVTVFDLDQRWTQVSYSQPNPTRPTRYCNVNPPTAVGINNGTVSKRYRKLYYIIDAIIIFLYSSTKNIYEILISHCPECPVAMKQFQSLITRLLWSPYVIGQTIIFSCCGLFFFFFLSFFSSPNLSSRGLDVYHTSAHGVVLV